MDCILFIPSFQSGVIETQHVVTANNKLYSYINESLLKNTFLTGMEM